MTGIRARPGPSSRIRHAIVAWSLALTAGVVSTASAIEAQAPPGRGESGVREITLDEALQIALESSPAMDQARASLATAEAQELSSFGRYLPSLSMGYGYSRSSGSGRLDPTGQAITNQSYSTQLRGSVTIFDGFSRENNLQSSRLGVDAAAVSYEQREFDALLSVKTAFYNAVAGQDRVEVETERVARQEEQLAFVREQFRLGQATQSDTLRARVDLNSAQLSLLTAENDARTAEFSLAESMGVPERVRPAAEASLETAPLALDREELVLLATDRAPAVRTAELDVASAEAGISAARSSYWPTLSASGGWDWRNNEFPPQDGSWSFSFSGSLPLFNGLQRETGIDRAQAQASQARAQQRTAELSIRSDVQSAYDQIVTALAGVDLAVETVEAAREDLRVTQQRFRVGIATSLDLRSAEITLQQAEVDLIRRRFDYQVGIARLESLLGMELDQIETLARSGEAVEDDGIAPRDPNPTPAP